MAMPKKEWIALNIKCNAELNEKLTQYCNETGLSKTKAVERALEKAIQEYEEKKNK